MAYIYDLTDTWNAGGTTFNGIKLNVTDSASAVSSKLVTLQTNGTEHFSVTKAGVGYFSGNVGIGVAPGAKLDVNGTIWARASAGAIGMDVIGRSADNGGQIRFLNNAANTTLGTLATYGNDVALLNNTAAYSLLLGTNGTERMRIDASGNVGIGTSVSYGSRLAVVPASTPTTVAGANQIQIGEASANTGYRMQLGYLNNGANGYNGSIQVYDNGNPEDLILNGAGGNVGIGTSSPGSKLEVVAQDAIRATGFQPFLTLRDSSDANKGSRIQTASATTIFYNDTTGGGTYTERMRIDSSGNLLVGTTTAIGGSSAYANIATTDGGKNGIAIGNSVAANATVAIRFLNSNGTVGSVITSGSATSFNTSSDERLKENIIDAGDAGSDIDAINVRQFDWKADGVHQNYGFIAQELLNVAPQAVYQPQDEKEMMGVDYSKLVPMLVKEIQSMRLRLAQLEGN